MCLLLFLVVVILGGCWCTGKECLQNTTCNLAEPHDIQKGDIHQLESKEDPDKVTSSSHLFPSDNPQPNGSHTVANSAHEPKEPNQETINLECHRVLSIESSQEPHLIDKWSGNLSDRNGDTHQLELTVHNYTQLCTNDCQMMNHNRNATQSRKMTQHIV